MSDYDWSQFTRKINIDAPAEAIYDAWTIPELLEKWLVRDVHFKRSNEIIRERFLHIQRGDHFAWRWWGMPEDKWDTGKVLEASEFERIQLSFTAGGIVTIDIGEALGENIVMLTQEKIPTDDKSRILYHLNSLAGWSFYLTNLKSFLEGGIDLRNKNTHLINMVNS